MTDAMEPVAKKQKTDEQAEDAEMKGEAEVQEKAPAEPEKPKELEADAPLCQKPKVAEPATYLVQDTTLNVLHSMHNNVLMALKDGGVQHLLAGARASVGVSKGRYLFEIKVVEPQTQESFGYGHQKRPFIRVGFSTATASLFLGESNDSVCFEGGGFFVHNKSRSKMVGQKAWRDHVIGVLLNLEEGSPNFNTISLFKDGDRMCPPQPLPDSLKGKALFPTLTFKNYTVHTHFGPTPLASMPFKCRMIGDATKTDAVVTKADVPADGKYEVVFPVGLPDEGTFDWLDSFLERNPKYTELSDRMVLDWAEKSGIVRQRGYGVVSRSNNDKPEMNFGVRELDDYSIQRALQEVSTLQHRHFVVMEVKGSLLKEERRQLLQRFDEPSFKKIAHIVVGEPTTEHKKRVQQIMLQQKQEMSNKTFEMQKLEKQRRKMMEKARKKIENEKKAAEEAKKKVEEQAKAAEEKKENEEEEEKKKGSADDEKVEEKKEEEPSAGAGDDDDDDEDPEEQPPKVELTEEEKKLTFRKPEVPDLSSNVLSLHFSKFSLPEKSEGFDDLRYEWSKGTKSVEYLKQWVAEKKLMMRVDDLQPSPWFEQKFSAWQKVMSDWHSKHNTYKTMQYKKASDREAKKRARAKAEQAKQRQAELKAKNEADEAAKKAAGEETKEGDAADGDKKAEGEEKPDEQNKEGEEQTQDTEDKKEEEKQEDTSAEDLEKKLAEEEAAADAEETELAADFEGLDIFGADDVLDIGKGVPLFKEFQFEDWALMGLSFELHLLAHAYRHDLDDPDRVGIHMNNLAFYYRKYFKKDLQPKDFGCQSLKDVVALVGDTVEISDNQVLTPLLEADIEVPAVFAKITEEARRHRLLRIDLGEEDAVLKFSHQSSPALHTGGERQRHKGGKGGGFHHQGCYGKSVNHGKGKSGFFFAGPYGKGGKDGGKGARVPAVVQAPHPQVMHPVSGWQQRRKGGGKF